MKKVKVMLLTTALVAIVGTFLAFNVKTTPRYCTAATIEVGGQKSCSGVSCVGTVETGISTGNSICYTTTAQNATTCPALCPTLGAQIIEE